MSNIVIRTDKSGKKHKGILSNCRHCNKELFIRLTQEHTGYCKKCFAHVTKPIKDTELFIQHEKYRTRAREIICKRCNKVLIVVRNQKHTGYCHQCNSELSGGRNYKNGIGNFRESALNHYGCFCQKCLKIEDCDLIEVHHIDKNRKNNELSNLMPLCIPCHHTMHPNANRKLTETQVLELRSLYPLCTIISLARKYNIGVTTVGHIIHRRSWKHI